MKEYKLYLFEDENYVEPDKRLSWLNFEAEEGWEVVCSIGKSNAWLLLSREKTIEAKNG
jgi:hypothetical protein